MKLFSTNTCAVLRQLSDVTSIDYDREVNPALAGMSEQQRNAIWGAVEDFYATGISPAVSLCVRRKGQIVINRAIGHRIGNGPEDTLATSKELMTPDMPVCLFSASKVVTALLIHLLDERGQIDILDPVSHYLPEFGVNGKRNATIYQLLAHRGGIPSIANVNPEMLYDVDGIVKLLCAAKPVSRPGHRMAYHAITAGYILGKIVEVVTGQSLRQFLHETIEKPMAMRHFNYGLSTDLRDQVAVNYATGFKPYGPSNLYIKRVLGGELEMAVDMTNDPRYMDTICPAGNIYTSAEEASRFFQMLLNGGEYNGQRIFNPMTIKRATLEAAKPGIDTKLLMPMRYSLGMMLGNSPIGMYGPNTRRAYGHLGMFNIFCWADPERDTSVAFLTTGKPIVGTHIPAMMRFLGTMSAQCPISS